MRSALTLTLTLTLLCACDVHPNVVGEWEGRCYGTPTPDGEHMDVPVTWSITSYDEHVLSGTGTVVTDGVNGLGDFDGLLDGTQTGERLFVNGEVLTSGFVAWQWHGWVGGWGTDPALYDLIEGGCTGLVGGEVYSALDLELHRQ